MACLHSDASTSGSSLTTYKFGNQIVTSLLLRFRKSLKYGELNGEGSGLRCSGNHWEQFRVEDEFDETALHNLKARVFKAPTGEWVDFVMQNRTQKGFVHEYDLVYGPVALYQDFKAEI